VTKVIAHNDVIGSPLQQVERIDSILRPIDLVALRSQCVSDKCADSGLVVHGQNKSHRESH